MARENNALLKQLQEATSTIYQGREQQEALVKALGTGFSGIYPSEITLEKDDLGKPSLVSSSLEDLDCHLSITNTDSYTLSFIVLEK